jgi:predicted GIY-YIG superfamily endonuclease
MATPSQTTGLRIEIKKMTRGRKITLYLVDGIPSGIIKGQIGNWVGLVTYAPRTKLDDLAADQDTKRPGVYVLTGPDPEDPTIRSVYIGESENVLYRLKQHEKDDDKGFFDYVAVITSTDENLTKGHIRYLESRLIAIAHQTKRATVDNNTRPELPPLPAADRDEMEVFLEHLQMLLPVLGLNFALPRPVRKVADLHNTIQSPQEVDSPIFIMSTKEQETRIEVTAQAQQIGGEFVVLADSTAFVRNQSRSYKDLKDRLIRNGSLVSYGEILTFVEDVPFNSPSAAAAVIRGQNTNGRIYWRLKDGTTYGDWFDARIAEEEHQSTSTQDDEI